MKVTFFQTGSFEIIKNGVPKKIFKSLDEATEYITENFVEENNEIWHILDLETRNVIMEFKDEEDSLDWEPDVNEIGFNPYLGDYDFDC